MTDWDSLYAHIMDAAKTGMKPVTNPTDQRYVGTKEKRDKEHAARDEFLSAVASLTAERDDYQKKRDELSKLVDEFWQAILGVKTRLDLAGNDVVTIIHEIEDRVIEARAERDAAAKRAEVAEADNAWLRETLGKIITHEKGTAEGDLFTTSVDCYACEEMQATARAALTASAPAQERGEWVSVEDRLPEVNKTVIFYDSGFDYYFGTWSGQKWYVQDTDQLTDTYVTHWRPLPTPPAQKGEQP